jgi:hypothetical protein
MKDVLILICIHIHMHTHIHTHMHIHTHIHMHMHMHIHMNTNTNTNKLENPFYYSGKGNFSLIEYGVPILLLDARAKLAKEGQRRLYIVKVHC